MSTIFLPSCKIKKKYRYQSEKLKKYLESRMQVETAGCCKVFCGRVLSSDTVVVKGNITAVPIFVGEYPDKSMKGLYDMRLSHGFAPVYDSNSKVLILGSFPSVRSREEGFYYGHPKNRFWYLLASLLDEPVPQGAESKRELLLGHGIALWDTVAACDIEGSSDLSISNVTVSDISGILMAADIDLIACNGRKAHELYKRFIEPETGRNAIYLPSTSPANAAWSMERLKEKWGVLLPYIIRKEKSSGFSFENVYRLVRMVPAGRVTTYGHIAMALGSIRWSRAVGYALHANPDGELTPCYRVVNKAGRVSDSFVFGGKNVQAELLRADGIPVSDEGYVQNLEKYIYFDFNELM